MWYLDSCDRLRCVRSLKPQHRVQEERDTMLKAAKKASTLGVDGKLIPDSEMAQRLVNLQNGNIDAATDELEQKDNIQASDGKRVKSLRESKSKQHKVARESSVKPGHKRKRKGKL